MDRLTIPDEPIEGGMRRAVVDCRVVKERAMTIYWRLKAYEDTGLEPCEIPVLLDKLKRASEQWNIWCDAYQKDVPVWVPVTERLPDKPGDYWVAMRHLDGSVTTVKMFWSPDWPHEDAWNEVVVAWQPYYYPEPFVPRN